MSMNPLDAYQNVEKATLSGRELEASVLTKAALLLLQVKNDWGGDGYEERLNDALRFNQRVWSIFQAEMTSDENPLPTEIKSNILNLSVFVDKRIFEVMAYPSQEKLDILININKNLAAGLLGDQV